MAMMKMTIASLLKSALLFGLLLPGLLIAEPIRDLVDISGVRENRIMGYGLVVGLDGTGDQTTQAPFTGQGITNMLSQLGVTIPPGTNMQLRNVAAVMVTANLPAFAAPGQEIDVVVSSIGNAKSLRGGTLLLSPLKGPNGQVYALAQGNLLVGGIGAEAAGSSVSVNHKAAGRIPGGAIVEAEVATRIADDQGRVTLQLKDGSFEMSRRVADAINREFKGDVAIPINGRMLKLQGPSQSRDMVEFIARVQAVNVDPAAPKAKVVINSRTGSVVMNERVTLRKAAVAHGNITVTIDTQYRISQPAPFGEGETVVVPESTVGIDREAGSLNLVEGADLNEVVAALNVLGATTDELMSILEALKASGALRAELEII